MVVIFSTQRSLPIRLALLLILAVLLVWVDGVSAKRISDADIALAVDTQLENDGGVPAHLIDVLSQDGIVSLSGSVPHLLAKQRAGELATMVKGVRSVVNPIEFPEAPGAKSRNEPPGALGGKV